MSDPREDILQRLVTVIEGAGIAGLTVLRNPVDVPDDKRPVAMLFDGSEKAIGGGANQRNAQAAPRIMDMRPTIAVVDRRSSAAVGTLLNEHRAKIVKAVMSDTTLWALSHNSVSVSYEGGATALARGKSVECDVDLEFSIFYVLRFSAL